MIYQGKNNSACVIRYALQSLRKLHIGNAERHFAWRTIIFLTSSKCSFTFLFQSHYICTGNVMPSNSRPSLQRPRHAANTSRSRCVTWIFSATIRSASLLPLAAFMAFLTATAVTAFLAPTFVFFGGFAHFIARPDVACVIFLCVEPFLVCEPVAFISVDFPIALRKESAKLCNPPLRKNCYRHAYADRKIC